MAEREKRLARRYARMLFNATGLEGAEEALQNLTVVNELIESSREIKNFFVSPLIGEAERNGAIEEVCRRIGLAREVRRFLLFMAKRRAVHVLSEVIRHFTAIYLEKKRKVKATVITPLRFNGGYEARLVESLKRLTGRDVDVEYLYDPDLLGGVVVKVGSTMYDSSLIGQLNLLKEEMLRG